MTWLVSAFEPFGGAQANSSLQALEQLQKLDWRGQVHFAHALPVTFQGAWPALLAQVEASGCDGILALGQSYRRPRLSLERVALNWIDTSQADNSGVTPQQGPIAPTGEPAIWSKIPWEKLETSANWERSYSAGTYVCNSLMYELAQWSNKNAKLSGFVHVPQANEMPTERAVESLVRILGFLTAL